MKKLSILLAALFFGGLLLNFTFIQSEANIIYGDDALNMSEDVKGVIDNSCYGCHNTETKNEKGLKKLNFDSFGSEYSNIKSAGKLKEIANVVNDNDMPPAKYLDHYPEKALSEKQKSLISEWAMAESKNFKNK